MAKPTTMNPKGVVTGSGSRKCWGCKMRSIGDWCVYRWWPQEMRPAYRFRIFRKVELLPTCRRENWDYPEREEFVQKYCAEAGIDYTPHAKTGRKGRGKGGRGRVAAKPMMI